MERISGRDVPVAVLNDRRRRAVQMRLSGMKLKEVSAAVQLTAGTIIAAMKAYRASGWSAVAVRPRGRSAGDGCILSPEQENAIRGQIRDRTPDQLKMPYALWSRAAVSQLIEHQFGIRLPVRTMGHYLKRWGFTPQKPIRKAYEQRPSQVKSWLTQQYPAIAARARQEGAEIYWGDETGLRSDDVRGRSYAPKGQTPVVQVGSRRESLSLISAVTNRGQVRWMLLKTALNADLLIEFFRRLIQDARRKVFVILDNLRVHHARVVRDWLDAHRDQIEVFYLPSYSPELNPDECLNADLKQALTSQAPARAKGQLKKRALSHLHKLSKSPNRVQKYFQHQSVRYAA